jgi:SAM-dependent methyltransferase
MKKNLLFDDHVVDDEVWYEEYPLVFRSEVEAFRQMLPERENLRGIEVGLGTGRFSQALGIKEGIEPSFPMRKLAVKRGIETMSAEPAELPYGDLCFDFVLMSFCISHFDELYAPFKEAYRVLKNDGSLILGFIDKDSPIGQYYERYKPENTFYKHANFYSVEKVLFTLSQVGFRGIKICQTLFGPLDEINTFQQAKAGYGEGSYIVVQARKKWKG